MAIKVWKHLQGKHDQKAHGRKGVGSVPIMADVTASEFPDRDEWDKIAGKSPYAYTFLYDPQTNRYTLAPQKPSITHAGIDPVGAKSKWHCLLWNDAGTGEWSVQMYGFKADQTATRQVGRVIEMLYDKGWIEDSTPIAIGSDVARYKAADFLEEVTKHFPGRHDQRRHGQRDGLMSRTATAADNEGQLLKMDPHLEPELADRMRSTYRHAQAITGSSCQVEFVANRPPGMTPAVAQYFEKGEFYSDRPVILVDARALAERTPIKFAPSRKIRFPGDPQKDMARYVEQFWDNEDVGILVHEMGHAAQSERGLTVHVSGVEWDSIAPVKALFIEDDYWTYQPSAYADRSSREAYAELYSLRVSPQWQNVPASVKRKIDRYLSGDLVRKHLPGQHDQKTHGRRFYDHVKYPTTDLSQYDPEFLRSSTFPYDHAYWHGSPNGEAGAKIAAYGIHVGTYEAAKQALEARVGKRPDGKPWDGTMSLREAGIKEATYHEPNKKPGGGWFDGPATRWEDRIPGKVYNSRGPVFSDGSPVPIDSHPAMVPLRIVGPMTNTPSSPHSDWKANGYMVASLKRGNARRGFFYTNEGEDAGSISAVVPSRAHLQTYDEWLASRVDKHLPGRHDQSTHGHKSPYFTDKLPPLSERIAELSHEDLMGEAMMSWRAWPDTMKLFLAMEAEGWPEPDQITALQRRRMARAMLKEFEQNAKDAPTLYRGGTHINANPDVPQSWTTSLARARRWAKFSGGKVYRLKGAKGLRMKDYAWDVEDQWLVRGVYGLVEVIKHYPGGKDHDQSTHGRKGQKGWAEWQDDRLTIYDDVPKDVGDRVRAALPEARRITGFAGEVQVGNAFYREPAIIDAKIVIVERRRALAGYDQATGVVSVYAKAWANVKDDRGPEYELYPFPSIPYDPANFLEVHARNSYQYWPDTTLGILVHEMAHNVYQTDGWFNEYDAEQMKEAWEDARTNLGQWVSSYSLSSPWEAWAECYTLRKSPQWERVPSNIREQIDAFLRGKKYRPGKVLELPHIMAEPPVYSVAQRRWVNKHYPGGHAHDQSAHGRRGAERSFEQQLADLQSRAQWPPKRTITAYKIFELRNGQLYPAMVKGQAVTPVAVGEWRRAEYLPNQDLAGRPGWHAGEFPVAPQLRSVKTGRITDNRLWAEVELQADLDYNAVAELGMEDPWRSKHKIPLGEGVIPEGGFYWFNTTSQKKQGGRWLISGGARIKRILSNAEVARILTEAGRTDDVMREQGPAVDEWFRRVGKRSWINKAGEWAPGPNARWRRVGEIPGGRAYHSGHLTIEKDVNEYQMFRPGTEEMWDPEWETKYKPEYERLHPKRMVKAAVIEAYGKAYELTGSDCPVVVKDWDPIWRELTSTWARYMDEEEHGAPYTHIEIFADPLSRRELRVSGRSTFEDWRIKPPAYAFGNYEDPLVGVIVHEMGHYDQRQRGITNDDLRKRWTDNYGWIRRISQYAIQKGPNAYSEAYAECFTLRHSPTWDIMPDEMKQHVLDYMGGDVVRKDRGWAPGPNARWRRTAPEPTVAVPGILPDTAATGERVRISPKLRYSEAVPVKASVESARQITGSDAPVDLIEGSKSSKLWAFYDPDTGRVTVNVGVLRRDHLPGYVRSPVEEPGPTNLLDSVLMGTDRPMYAMQNFDDVQVGLIVHEMGHAEADKRGITDTNVKKLFSEGMKLGILGGISVYAMRNGQEAWAECWTLKLSPTWADVPVEHKAWIDHFLREPVQKTWLNKHLQGQHDQKTHGRSKGGPEEEGEIRQPQYHTGEELDVPVGWDETDGVSPKIREDLQRRALKYDEMQDEEGNFTAKGFPDDPDEMSDNMMKWWDQATPAERAEGAAWYQGAHDEVMGWSESYSVPMDRSVAAVAVMSPGRNWENNMYGAQAVVRIIGEDKPFEVTQEMLDEAAAAYHPINLPPGTYKPSALWGEALANLHPELFKDKRIYVGQAPSVHLSRAIDIVQGRLSVEDGVKGAKVRNFFNSLLNPLSDRWACADVHIIRTGLPGNVEFIVKSKNGPWQHLTARELKPRVPNHQAVDTGYFFSSNLKDPTGKGPYKYGLYPMFAEALQRSAKKAGVRPLEFQATIWIVMRDHGLLEGE